MRNHVEFIVALCDKELVGKKLREGELNLHVNPRFYKGELVDEGAIDEAFKSATIANIVGKRAINLAIDKGLILKDNVITIDGIPHAQMILFQE